MDTGASRPLYWSTRNTGMESWPLGGWFKGGFSRENFCQGLGQRGSRVVRAAEGFIWTPHSLYPKQGC